MTQHFTPRVETESEEALYLELYRRMWLIRRFEDEVQALFLKSLVHGTTHLCSGQEAGCVGVASVLTDADRVSCTYRGHGAVLAMGATTALAQHHDAPGSSAGASPPRPASRWR